MIDTLLSIFTMAIFLLGCFTAFCAVLLFALYWFNFRGLKND